MKGFGGGGMANLLKQATQMQNKIKKTQEELAQRQFQATSGGGAVQVTLNGDYRVERIEIQKEIWESGDREILQDMLKVALNEAVKKIKDTTQAEMQKITGGIGLPFF